jgi:hypothetical protein
MCNTYLRFAAIVMGTLLLASCATAPTQEMSDARQAVRAAQEAGASSHAPTRLEKARELLNRAESDLKTADKETFKQARENALAAKKEALNARQLAIAISEAKSAVAEAVAGGVLSAETQKLLQQSVAAAASGDDETAIDLARRAKMHAEQDMDTGGNPP